MNTTFETRKTARVKYSGNRIGGPKYGTIVGTIGPFVRIRLDGEVRAGNYHKAWKLEYDPSEEPKP